MPADGAAADDEEAASPGAASTTTEISGVWLLLAEPLAPLAAAPFAAVPLSPCSAASSGAVRLSPSVELLAAPLPPLARPVPARGGRVLLHTQPAASTSGAASSCTHPSATTLPTLLALARRLLLLHAHQRQQRRQNHQGQQRQGDERHGAVASRCISGSIMRRPGSPPGGAQSRQKSRRKADRGCHRPVPWALAFTNKESTRSFPAGAQVSGGGTVGAVGGYRRAGATQAWRGPGAQG